MNPADNVHQIHFQAARFAVALARLVQLHQQNIRSDSEIEHQSSYAIEALCQLAPTILGPLHLTFAGSTLFIKRTPLRAAPWVL
ncbi:MAG: hypothetical protein CSA75_01635, partial [Sorangium cellulosum]